MKYWPELCLICLRSNPFLFLSQIVLIARKPASYVRWALSTNFSGNYVKISIFKKSCTGGQAPNQLLMKNCKHSHFMLVMIDREPIKSKSTFLFFSIPLDKCLTFLTIKDKEGLKEMIRLK